MRTLGNILWHVPFLGFLSALATFLLGGLLVITIIGAPIGLGLIQLSEFLLTPFSKSMIDKEDLKGSFVCINSWNTCCVGFSKITWNILQSCE